jgi:hypothetical protein
MKEMREGTRQETLARAREASFKLDSLLNGQP